MVLRLLQNSFIQNHFAKAFLFYSGIKLLIDHPWNVVIYRPAAEAAYRQKLPVSIPRLPKAECVIAADSWDHLLMYFLVFPDCRTPVFFSDNVQGTFFISAQIHFSFKHTSVFCNTV